MHHILRAVDFHPVEANLRQSFRALAAGRPRSDVLELPGVTIASLGVAFQMFNAAFLNGPVVSLPHLELQLELAHAHFSSRGMEWSFWFCEDWLAKPVRRHLTAACSKHHLRLSSELPGMITATLAKQKRALPHLQVRRADSPSTLSDFRTVGGQCFRVPPAWFAEVFHDSLAASCQEFACWVGYLDGLPVATAATLVAAGAIGLYNIATVPGYRGRGVAEAITRLVAGTAQQQAGPLPLILQSTSQGRRMYDNLGFRETARILVFNSESVLK